MTKHTTPILDAVYRQQGKWYLSSDGNGVMVAAVVTVHMDGGKHNEVGFSWEDILKRQKQVDFGYGHPDLKEVPEVDKVSVRFMRSVDNGDTWEYTGVEVTGCVRRKQVLLSPLGLFYDGSKFVALLVIDQTNNKDGRYAPLCVFTSVDGTEWSRTNNQIRGGSWVDMDKPYSYVKTAIGAQGMVLAFTEQRFSKNDNVPNSYIYKNPPYQRHIYPDELGSDWKDVYYRTYREALFESNDYGKSWRDSGLKLGNMATTGGRDTEWPRFVEHIRGGIYTYGLPYAVACGNDSVVIQLSANINDTYNDNHTQLIIGSTRYALVKRAGVWSKVIVDADGHDVLKSMVSKGRTYPNPWTNQFHGIGEDTYAGIQMPVTPVGSSYMMIYGKDIINDIWFCRDSKLFVSGSSVSSDGLKWVYVDSNYTRPSMMGSAARSEVSVGWGIKSRRWAIGIRGEYYQQLPNSKSKDKILGVDYVPPDVEYTNHSIYAIPISGKGGHVQMPQWSHAASNDSFDYYDDYCTSARKIDSIAYTGGKVSRYSFVGSSEDEHIMHTGDYSWVYTHNGLNTSLYRLKIPRDAGLFWEKRVQADEQ